MFLVVCFQKGFFQFWVVFGTLKFSHNHQTDIFLFKFCNFYFLISICNLKSATLLSLTKSEFPRISNYTTKLKALLFAKYFGK